MATTIRTLRQGLNSKMLLKLMSAILASTRALQLMTIRFSLLGALKRHDPQYHPPYHPLLLEEFPRLLPRSHRRAGALWSRLGDRPLHRPTGSQRLRKTTNTIRSDTQHRSMVCRLRRQYRLVGRREQLLLHRKLRDMMMTTSTKRRRCKHHQSRQLRLRPRSVHHLCLLHRPNHRLGRHLLLREAAVRQWMS